MHGKLHRVKVTEAQKDYVGSISIDQALLEKAGILPLEQVNVVNVTNGQRWETYVLPGKEGQICPNGGGAFLCERGDLLIIWSDELLERSAVMQNGHQARVVIADSENCCEELLYQTLTPSNNGFNFTFDAAKIDVEQQPAFEIVTTEAQPTLNYQFSK